MILRHLLFWAASPHNSLFFTRTWFPSLFPQIPAVLNPHSNRKFFVGMFGRAWRPRGSPKKEPEVLFIGRPCCDIYIYVCVLVWYQQKPLYCTIKWIKTKLQAKGYGCHTCQHIHHYTLLTSWLYPKEMRKFSRSKVWNWVSKCLREKFSCWLCNENE